MENPNSGRPDLPSQFQEMSMSGGQFNPYATPFQPGVFGGNQLYGTGAYPMGGRPMQRPGMYNMPPPHVMAQPGYIMQHPGYHHPGMMHAYSNPAPQHHVNPANMGDSKGRGLIPGPALLDRRLVGIPQSSDRHLFPTSEIRQQQQQSAVDTSPRFPGSNSPHPPQEVVPDSWEDHANQEEPKQNEVATVKTENTGSPHYSRRSKEQHVTESPGSATLHAEAASSNGTRSGDPRPSHQYHHPEKKSSDDKSSKPAKQGSSPPSIEKPAKGGSVDSAPGRSASSGSKATVVPPKGEDEKENVNIVFIGHVDAGKSTIGGHVMYLTGQVDKRTLEKYEREAREKNRETWYLSWALDTNSEEREKGKTVEVGRAFFETEKKRFTILDAPGHAGFVPNMISGTVQADIGVLVISARRGEFETGFERRGQTREHAMLAKTAGVKHLIVLVNKMDDPTVEWSEERYDECRTKLTPFLKKVGFNPKTDLFFIPVSGLTGANLKEQAEKSVCSWYSGPAFIPYLDKLPPIVREDQGPFRMPIADKYKDMGIVVLGKVESGCVSKGNTLLLMPNRSNVEVLAVIRSEEDVCAAYSGDNIKLKLKGVEEEDISSGFVLCGLSDPCHVGRVFDAQIVILEYKSIICAGFSCVIHIHNVVEEVEIVQLIGRIDKKTGKKIPERPKFIKQDQTAIARLQTSGVICLEEFKHFPPMARFTLRDEGKTIAIGKVLKIVE